MITKLEINEIYWYFNEDILRELPKQAQAKEIDRNIVIFDHFIGNEKFTDSSIINSLYYTYEDAMKSFMKFYLDKTTLKVLSDEISEKIKNDYPEYFL